jgi:UDPglucose--hexose-1-phosphate uridylyltransferase
VPDGGYTVLRYPNDFPALSKNPPEPDDVAGGLFETAPSYGRCEVLLYDPRHNATLKELGDSQVRELARMWRDVYADMEADPGIKYVYAFENRGEMVGVTMPHPHGQAYGYPFLPKRIEEEISGAKAHYDRTGGCIFCELLKAEREDGRRVIFENDCFCAYIPFFSQVAYGLNVTAKRHLPSPTAMTEAELDSLGETVRGCAALYDALFDRPMPYMMCMHAAPPGGEHDEYYHFHIEFVPPVRGENRQQFFASSETGAGAFCNPTCPEEKAKELREAAKRAGL